MPDPDLTQEMLDEGMARAGKVTCGSFSTRCFAFPDPLDEARASCTPKGRCKIGWIVAEGAEPVTTCGSTSAPVRGDSAANATEAAGAAGRGGIRKSGQHQGSSGLSTARCNARRARDRQCEQHAGNVDHRGSAQSAGTRATETGRQSSRAATAQDTPSRNAEGDPGNEPDAGRQGQAQWERVRQTETAAGQAEGRGVRQRQRDGGRE
jgi:hypothetical protein